jgi:hypothetical protein
MYLQVINIIALLYWYKLYNSHKTMNNTIIQYRANEIKITNKPKMDNIFLHMVIFGVVEM